MMTLRPDGPEGLAIRLVLEGGALHITVNGAHADDVPWLRDAVAQLTDRGLDLSGFDLSDASDDARARWERELPDHTPGHRDRGRHSNTRGMLL